MKVFQLSKLEQMPTKTRRGSRGSKGGVMSIDDLKKTLSNKPISDMEALKIIIDRKKFEPTIVNPESKFVVVTYWWGRGNKNMNTARPCPDERKTIIEEEGITEYIYKDLLAKNPEATEQEKREAVLEELKSVVKAQGKEWQDPIKYEEMIAKWEEECRRFGCNYAAVEYPEFAVQKGYQLAINAKPLFIAKALEMCEGRGVLYIDGDMFIKQYPGVFDMPNVDYMARAWECDPRSSYRFKPLARFTPNDLFRMINLKRRTLVKEINSKIQNMTEERQEMIDNVDKTLKKLARDAEAAGMTGADLESMPIKELAIKYPFIKVVISLKVLSKIKEEQRDGSVCYDPYVFQTSGGTMFFGHTDASKRLLALWEELAGKKLMAGKADDRVISMLMQQRHLFTLVNFVSLPIEFLWLTGNYETFMKDQANFKRSDLVIEHPECLTSEEAAVEQGAASDRQPKFYNKIVESAIDCNRDGGVLYEKSYFGDKAMTKTFRPYLDYMDQLPQKLLKVVPYSAGFAQKQRIVDENHAAASAAKVDDLPMSRGIPTVSTIPEAIALLSKGTNCAYVPEGRSLGPSYMDAYTSPLNYELIAVNVGEPSDEDNELDPEYKPDFSLENPIIFKAGNDILIDMLSLCRNFEDLTAVFTSGYMWLYRIRSKWVKPSNNTANSATGHANAKSSAEVERLMMSAENKRVGGVRRKTRKARRSRVQTRRRY